MATAIDTGSLGTDSPAARIYLLELQIGPTIVRIATESISVSSDYGDLYYDGGLLGIEMSRAFSVDSGTTEPDVPIDIAPGTLNIGALLNAGHDIASAVGELSVIELGDSYEQRDVIVAGRVSEPVYGLASEPVAFSLRLALRQTRKMIPRLESKLDRGLWRFGTIPEGSWGFNVPFVFGSPGEVFGKAATGLGRLAGSPAYAVVGPFTTAEVAICEWAIDSATSTVELAYADDEPLDRTWVSSAVVQTLNADGMAFAAIPASGLYDGSDRTRFLVRWTNGGAALNWSQTGPISTVGELLEFLLHRLGDVDAGRTAAVIEQLPYLVDGYIDARVDIIDWLRSNVLSVFPVALARSGKGLYPVVGRPWLDPQMSAPELSVERREIHRIGPVEYDQGDQLANEIEIQYGLDAGTRQHVFAAVLTGRDDTSRTSPDASDADEVRIHFSNMSPGLSTSRRCQVSRARYGEQARVIKTNIVSRPETAFAVASWMAQRYALPTRVAKYGTTQLPRSATLGGGLYIVDIDRGINGLCCIEGIEDLRGGEQIITVRTVERAG